MMPSKRREARRLVRLLAAFIATVLAGCAVGPDFRRPDPPAVASYTPEALPTETAEAKVAGGASQRFAPGEEIPAQWWTLFHSEALDQLIRQALADSPTLAAAQATLREAEENRRAQLGALFPSVDASASATRQKISGASFGQPGPRSPAFTLYNASVNVSYTLDLFGGTRRGLEALQAQVDYQRFQLEGAWLTLTANIVTTAVQEASLRAQIRATQEILAAEEQQLALVEQQFQLGGASRPDVLAQRAQLAQTRATLPPLEKQLAQTRHRLAVLAGRFPGEAGKLPEFDLDGLQPAAGPTGEPPFLAGAAAPGHPRRGRASPCGLRPDRRGYGEPLPADYTDPPAYGSEASEVGDLFGVGTSIWSIWGLVCFSPSSAAVSFPPRRRAAIAAYDQAEAQYRETVLEAFQNVADVLRALEKDAQTLKAQAEAEAVSPGFARPDPEAVPTRRGELSYAAQRRTPAPAGADQPRPGAGRTFCRHRGALPGAGRRMVEGRRLTMKKRILFAILGL